MTRWAGSSAWYALDGAEERPVRKALPEEPEGRGSESRPVHHIYRLLFPSFGRFSPDWFGSEAWVFSGLRDFLGGENPHNVQTDGLTLGAYLLVALVHECHYLRS